MKLKYSIFLIILVFVFTACKKEEVFEYQNTELSIQYSDDVSPCRAWITPEQVGKVQTWNINGKMNETEFAEDSCTMEIIMEPQSETHLQYETRINNTVYTYDEVIESPPVANKLTIYSMNFFNHPINVEDNILSFHYDYDFPYTTENSTGVISEGGGRGLIYKKDSSLRDLYSPVEVELSPSFGDLTTPQVFNFEIKHMDSVYIASSIELQDLYFNYDDAFLNNPDIIKFNDQISGQDYELIVDWSHTEM
jgi:hypothetical protein